MIDKSVLFKRLSLAVYFIAAFLVFVVLLLPYDRIKAKIEQETRTRTGLDLSIARISPLFINSVVLTDVVVSDPKGAVLFESPSARAAVSLFSLLGGKLGTDVKAKAYGGTVLIRATLGTTQQQYQIDAEGLDIGAYTLLRNLGFKLTGKLGGNFEMTGEAGKGRFWLKSATSRELKIKGFTVPDLDFDQGWLEADLKGDRLTIKKLELDGKELKVRCLGDVILRERGSINVTIRLKPSERIAHEQAALLSLLKTKDAEGFYQFSVGGTLAEPFPRL
ncbi:MAG TPA: type II secretion system protein GspN [Nitrospirota bacterium]|nr:type II secretion system protein GspN [Nitrospirota bacterium]